MGGYVFENTVGDNDTVMFAVNLGPEAVEVVSPRVVLELENS
jgi:hypothetical protein